MRSIPRRTPMGACRSCGAYGNRSHSFSCQVDREPPKRFQRGPSRLALRDSLRSAAVRAYYQVQERMVRDV